MKVENFTLKVFLMAVIICAAVGLKAQNTGTGLGWGDLGFTSGIVLEEDFTSFAFFGSWTHTANSNSKPSTDEGTGETIRGTKEGDTTFLAVDAKTTYITYSYDSCAFAPEWGVAASVDGDGIDLEEDPTTSGVSDGFVEIARLGYGTCRGEFLVDLRELDYIEGVQYSHSSCGGNRRGLTVLVSLDDSVTWDTLHYQPGESYYESSFVMDPSSGDKEYNEYNCEPSAYGMLWEAPVYSSNVMLMFTSNSENTQAVRIHDLKVYGDLPSSDGVNDLLSDDLTLKVYNNVVHVSDQSNVGVYSITGKLVKSASDVTALSLSDLSYGIYIVKAEAGNNIVTTKFVKK